MNRDKIWQYPITDCPKDDVRELIHKWNTHGYPKDSGDGFKQIAREQCARELLELCTPKIKMAECESATGRIKEASNL